MAYSVRICTAVSLNRDPLITLMTGVYCLVSSRTTANLLTCLHESSCVNATLITKEHTHEPV
jgi:hypothetical protein